MNSAKFGCDKSSLAGGWFVVGIGLWEWDCDIAPSTVTLLLLLWLFLSDGSIFCGGCLHGWYLFHFTIINDIMTMAVIIFPLRRGGRHHVTTTLISSGILQSIATCWKFQLSGIRSLVHRFTKSCNPIGRFINKRITRQTNSAPCYRSHSLKLHHPQILNAHCHLMLFISPLSCPM